VNPDGTGWRRQRRRCWARLIAQPYRGSKAAAQKADRGAFDIAFDAGDLAGEAQPRHRLQAQQAVEQAWAVEDAVQATGPGEFGPLHYAYSSRKLAGIARLGVGISVSVDKP
jgi:hypothetical protein